MKNDTSGKMTVRIFDIAIELGYDGHDTEKLRMLLLHDIRNALSHIGYRYVYNNDDSFKSIIWMDMKDKPNETSYEELFEIAKKKNRLSLSDVPRVIS